VGLDPRCRLGSRPCFRRFCFKPGLRLKADAVTLKTACFTRFGKRGASACLVSRDGSAAVLAAR